MAKSGENNNDSGNLSLEDPNRKMEREEEESQNLGSDAEENVISIDVKSWADVFNITKLKKQKEWELILQVCLSLKIRTRTKTNKQTKTGQNPTHPPVLSPHLFPLR